MLMSIAGRTVQSNAGHRARRPRPTEQTNQNYLPNKPSKSGTTIFDSSRNAPSMHASHRVL